MDLNMIDKTIQFQRDNVGENQCDFVFDDDLNTTLKV
jgi:hypothetical protein